MKYPEYHIQTSINDLLSRAGTCLYFHVPNRPKSGEEWKKMARMGALAGVADLVFPAPGSRFLELKSAKGVQTADQKAFQAACAEYGMEYALCKSFDEAYEQLKTWRLI